VLLVVVASTEHSTHTQGRPEPYICTVYDRMYGAFPAESTVCTPYIPRNVWFWPALLVVLLAQSTLLVVVASTEHTPHSAASTVLAHSTSLVVVASMEHITSSGS